MGIEVLLSRLRFQSAFCFVRSEREAMKLTEGVKGVAIVDGLGKRVEEVLLDRDWRFGGLYLFDIDTFYRREIAIRFPQIWQHRDLVYVSFNPLARWLSRWQEGFDRVNKLLSYYRIKEDGYVMLVRLSAGYRMPKALAMWIEASRKRHRIRAFLHLEGGQLSLRIPPEKFARLINGHGAIDNQNFFGLNMLIKVKEEVYIGVLPRVLWNDRKGKLLSTEAEVHFFVTNYRLVIETEEGTDTDNDISFKGREEGNGKKGEEGFFIHTFEGEHRGAREGVCFT